MEYRIGIDARLFGTMRGGIGRYSRELIAGLAAIDRENYYRVYLTEADLPDWTVSQPNFEPVVVPHAHYSLAEQTGLLRQLMADRLDLVHFLNFNHPLLYPRPFITTLHDLTVYLNPIGRSQRSRLRRLGFVLSLRHAVAGAKKVISISEFTAKDASRYLGVPHAKMEVIYEGSPQPVEFPFGSKAMAQEAIGRREPYILFISQWRPHKGLGTLIDAFARFKRATGAPHILVLLGNQKDAPAEIREQLALSPVAADIVAPGFMEGRLLPILYHHAAAFVMPSEYEGFGLPVLEAYSYGAPVIAADNSSLPEVVGSAGKLFPTRDAAALAETLASVALDEPERQRMIQAGFAQAAKFTWPGMAAKTHALYMETLAKGR